MTFLPDKCCQKPIFFFQCPTMIKINAFFQKKTIFPLKFHLEMQNVVLTKPSTEFRKDLKIYFLEIRKRWNFVITPKESFCSNRSLVYIKVTNSKNNLFLFKFLALYMHNRVLTAPSELFWQLTETLSVNIKKTEKY